MRAPNSPRALRATGRSSCSMFALVFTSAVISVVVLASPASTRSVARHHEPGHLEDRFVSEKSAAGEKDQGLGEESAVLGLEDSDKGAKPGLHSEIGTPISEEIGKSPADSEFQGAKSAEGVEKSEGEEGIRRFDAIVVSEEASGKSERGGIDGSEIGKTVTKGIIVRDAAVVEGFGGETGDVEPTAVKVHRKRSLTDLQADTEKTKEEEGKEDEIKKSSDGGSAPSEEISESAELQRNEQPIPVVGSHARLENAQEAVVPETSGLGEKESVGNAEALGEEARDEGQEEAKEEIGMKESAGGPQIQPVVVEESGDKMEEPKKVIIHEDGLGEVIDPEIVKQEVLNARKSLPISDDGDKEDESAEARSEEDAKVEEIPEKSAEESAKPEAEPPKSADEESYLTSMSNAIKSNESLESLKAQAIALQREISMDKSFLQKLKENPTDILPGIPIFTENQLLDALKTVTLPRKSEEPHESSYLSKLNTSDLNANQLQILKSAECLLAREQRQTFAENMFECIRGFSILNCMKIFVWPILADNLPESFIQNLPTLPIEINVAELLPGNQQEIPKKTRLRSASSSSPQQRLITPELVVSGILKDALNADPSKFLDTLPTYIDPQNETLSKLLTPGQLEILKMAEKFLPESSRREYSNKMFSCVRRFEYFSCVKYFAWPMVKQHYAGLPDFPDYQSWYPSVAVYPGYPILPFPNAEGIGELPEVVEADATRTRSPRPEAVIVRILENALQQGPSYTSAYSTYQARKPAAVLAPITADQMAIFYTAEQLIPIQLRAEFMSKTMKCIRDYDYLTCTKYSTWPAVRQWFPALPALPDFSSWIPTFAVPELPDFSQYIPDLSSFIPNFPGGSTTTPKPTEAKPIPESPPQESQNATTSTRGEQRISRQSIESQIIEILSNIRRTSVFRPLYPLASITPASLAVLRSLSFDQLKIVSLSKNALPESVIGDLDSRLVGCLQGGSDFISCTRNVVWPTLKLYVRNMPDFPRENEGEEAKEPSMQKLSEAIYSFPSIKPGVYQPVASHEHQAVFTESPAEVAGRSPTDTQIAAEPEESTDPGSRTTGQSLKTESAPDTQQGTVASLRTGVAAKSSDPSVLPVISVTDTRFTPIFSDHPETVLLNILTTVQSSSKYADNSYNIEKPEHVDSFGPHLNPDQKNVIRVSENLLPDKIKSEFTERVKECIAKYNFVVCSRDTIWPTLSSYYPRLPSFPNFYLDDSNERILSGASDSIKTSPPGAISETDVKTGQHGDALVTITDTRFVPLFSQHPEAVILNILRNVQATSPNLLDQGSIKTPTRSSEFLATFTDQQGNIVTIAENLLPETIRQVFTKRMSECVKENSFLSCTRDIAWPTIAQFFPRLPNFPNIGALPEYAIGKPQQASLLPPQLELAKPSLAPQDQGLPLPVQNQPIPLPLEDFESRIESMLKKIPVAQSLPQVKFSYLDIKDPAVSSFVTERQASFIRMCERLLPTAIKPVFVGKMVDCARLDVFPNCVRTVGWPMLRQYGPGIPDLPDLGSYLPLPEDIPQFPDYEIPEVPEIPQIPQVPQVPQVPQIPQIPQIPQNPYLGYPGFGYPGYAFRTAGQIGQEASIGPGHQQLRSSGVYYVPEAKPGLTPSVDSASTWSPGSPGSPGLPSTLVPEFLSGPGAGSSDVPSERRRKRRHASEEPPATYQDVSSDESLQSGLPANMTEPELLKILANLSERNKEIKEKPSQDYAVESLNSTIKDSLTSEQLAILKFVEDMSGQTAKGFMSKVFQCIRSLSFLRCMGIFVWPVITQNVPSLLGLPTLGSFIPFARSSPTEERDVFEELFGMTSKDFEEELLDRKEKVEGILLDWYRGVVENKYDNEYGLLRVQGYGDGEIGISLSGLKRKARGAKIKDSKNMPSILTIISDIMEDVLDQRESKPEKKDHDKKRDRSLGYEEDDFNRVSSEADRQRDVERSTNDDRIIAMFLEKIRDNSTDDLEAAETGNGEHNYVSVNDAYEAFELLFGTRLTERMAERLRKLDKHRYRVVSEEKVHKNYAKNLEETKTTFREVTDKQEDQQEGSTDDKVEKRKKIRSGLLLRLPKIDEEIVSRKTTSNLIELGRKMKVQMSQLVPGITFLLSFFVQMALAHARAAASVAGMMSNMALGSAMLSMVRQMFFGSMGHPKVKHVYDNPAMGPGITWPTQNSYHG